MSHNSSSNYRRNKAEIDKFRKELKSMLDNISDIDVTVLNKAVNEGVKDAKDRTNVVTGHMRRSWRSTPAIKSSKGEVTKDMVNTADYAPYVNNGHRIVNKSGETIGLKDNSYLKRRFIK